MDEQNKQKTYQVVIKSAYQEEEKRQHAPMAHIYNAEINMYTKLLPEFLKFQKKYNLKQVFDEFAKCYCINRTEKNEKIMLENMKLKGNY